MATSNRGFIRMRALIERISVSKSTIWAWVHQGKFPAPVKLSDRVTAWRAADIARGNLKRVGRATPPRKGLAVPNMSRKRRVRGRGVDATGRNIGTDRHLRLPHFLLQSQAWVSLQPNERALFVEVAQRYNGQNNGQIGLGVREAGKALQIRPQTAGLAFDVLLERGFLHIGRTAPST